MPNVFALAVAFPSVVYTVLVAVSLLYWGFVMVGAVHLNTEGADGALDGAGGDGGLDAGGDGIDGAGHGGHGGHGDAGDGGGHGGDDGGDGGDADGAQGGGHHGVLSGLMASLKLRSVPATVVLSLIVLFAWLFSIFGMQATAAWLPEGLYGVARFAVFVIAPVLALPFASIMIRPLAPLFAPPKETKHQSLVGKVCTVRTGTVTDRFGEALLEDGGAGLVVRVRVDTGQAVKRGDQVVITGYDAARQEFSVAPMENLLDEREAEREEAAGDPADSPSIPAEKRAKRP
jgi:hypothetical protein